MTRETKEVMIKKIKKYLRLLTIFTAWSIFYIYFIGFLMNLFWHFNIFSQRHWKMIDVFWQNGGVIKNDDYIFFLMLILILPCWIWGFKKSLKLSYIKIIFFPFFWYNAHLEKKYAKQQSRIVLKNMGVLNKPKQSQQERIEEMISNRMPIAKNPEELNSNKIRTVFQQKNESFHEKIKTDNE